MQISSGDINITRICHNASDVKETEEWCELAGHWSSRTHILKTRTIEEMILIYCLEGGGWGTINNKKFEIKPGDIFFCPRNKVHSYGCDNKTGWAIKWIHLGGSNAEKLCNKAGMSIKTPLFNIGIDSSISRHFDEIISSLSRTNRDAAWDSARLLHSLLLLLIKRHSSFHLENKGLIDLIDGDYKTLDELVDKSGYSKHHFCRLFKAETGKTPWQAVVDRRLERGKELLLGSKLPIKHISFELGFDNPDYFSRVFRKKFGLNPKEFRGY